VVLLFFRKHQDDWGVLQVAYAFEQAAGLRERPALAQNGI